MIRETRAGLFHLNRETIGGGGGLFDLNGEIGGGGYLV